MDERIKKYLSVFGAIMAWAAVLTQYYLIFGLMDVSDTEINIRFFSFFTIWANLLVATYFTAINTGKNLRVKRFFERPGMLTSIAVYITLVGSIYHLLLTAVWTPHGLAKVANEFLHTIIPIYVIVFWVLYEKKHKLKWKQILRWLIFPLAYLAVAMIRGRISGWYPYPFFDLNKLGISHLVLNIGMLLMYFFVLAFLFTGIAKLIAVRRRSP